jgi:DNA-binding MarR family transcriptional regulator
LASHDQELELTAAAYDRLVDLLATARTPELLDSTITMAQLKVLMLLSVVGEQRMSDLAAQLGVSLSTTTGLVDRLVDGGLAQRREHASDRRAVLVSMTFAGSQFMERFQELGAGQLRELLSTLDSEQLGVVRQAIEVLLAAAGARQRDDRA